MTNKILLFILGMLLGIVFQDDIPIIKEIDHKSIRSHLVGIFDSFVKEIK